MLHKTDWRTSETTTFQWAMCIKCIWWATHQHLQVYTSIQCLQELRKHQISPITSSLYRYHNKSSILPQRDSLESLKSRKCERRNFVKCESCSEEMLLWSVLLFNYLFIYFTIAARISSRSRSWNSSSVVKVDRCNSV